MTSPAERFRALHAPGKFLVLPNAWDAASARLAQEAGAAAVATSSAALAWCHGYSDGEALPTSILLAAASEILRVVSVPVSVDSEAGYSPDPAAAADYAARLIDMGIAGINLEDGREPHDLHLRKIEAIKKQAAKMGGDLFVNARTDVYLKQLVPAHRMLEETLARGKRFAAAGADGFFVPFVKSLDDIGEIATTVALPLNVLSMPDLPPVSDLRKAGARRLSTGAGPGRAAYGAAVRAARQLLGDGRYDAMYESAADCPNFNALFGE